MAESDASQPQSDLPFLEDGVFRDRGAVNTRLETFVDAAFAFTLTLLVISFDRIPANIDELLTALRSVPAFLASFLLLMMFWFAHRAWSRRYGLDSTGAALISAMLIFILLVYVYPLRALMSAALWGMTSGWVPKEMTLTSAFDARVLFVIYGIGYGLACLCILLLYVYAYAKRVALQLSEAEKFLTRVEITSWSILGSMGVVSIVLALSMPQAWIQLAGWTYASLGIVMPTFGWFVTKRFQRLFPDY